MNLQFVLLFLFGSIAVAAQQSDSTTIAPVTPPKSDSRTFTERIRVGGATGFWINTKQAHLDLAALVAYDLTRMLTTGVGYRYIYTRNLVYGKDLNSWGPNLFIRASLTRRIYLWSEWEHLNTQYITQAAGNTLTTSETGLNSFFAGVGYIRQIGRKGRGGLSFQVLYNFLYDKEAQSPYYSPVTYRVGYFF